MPERDAYPPALAIAQTDAAGEDFLFHLYRGSELLQDNRVHDAKAELEQALALQPSDPKGQDLLAIVYFRLGLFPRAIAIYEQLVRAHPDAMEPRINLALSYLKTSQPARASVELERVLKQNPGHSRAWGYLGLALQRLGDHERASQAFLSGGHDAMARRVLAGASSGPPAQAAPAPSPAGAAGVTGGGSASTGAGQAQSDFHELGGPDELGEEGIANEVIAARTATATWQPIERGRSQIPPPGPAPEIAIGSLGSLASEDAALLKAMTEAQREAESIRVATITGLREPLDPPPAEAAAPDPWLPLERPGSSLPKPISELLQSHLVTFPRRPPATAHASGAVLLRSLDGFIAKVALVRSLSTPSDSTATPLPRRTRGRILDEPLGGSASPLVELSGVVEIVLTPEPVRRLQPITLGDEPLYLREELLAAFDRKVSYENGRLPVDEGEAIPMIQLRGAGIVVASLPERVLSVHVVQGRRALVRGLAVLGWTGRLVPRALTSNEAPGGAKGLVALAGEGMVLLDVR